MNSQGQSLNAGLELEAIRIDELALRVQADIAHLHEFRLDPGLSRQILEEAHRLAILDRIAICSEMDKAAGREDHREAIAQAIEQAC